MKQKTSITSSPSTMRVALVSASVLVIIATVALAVFSRSYLTEYANTVADITAESENTQATLDSLGRAENSLAEKEEAVQKAQRIVAESKQYKYQNQIINDLTAYAGEANLSISSFTFSGGGGSGSGSPAPVVSGEMPPGVEAGGEAGGEAVEQQQLAELKSAQVTIGLPSQIAYNDLLKFLSLIENNATRMQVQGLTIAPASSSSPDGSPAAAAQGGNSNTVTINTLTIGVYIR